jgi:hypothetical protein
MWHALSLDNGHQNVLANRKFPSTNPRHPSTVNWAVLAWVLQELGDAPEERTVILKPAHFISPVVKAAGDVGQIEPTHELARAAEHDTSLGILDWGATVCAQITPETLPRTTSPTTLLSASVGRPACNGSRPA